MTARLRLFLLVALSSWAWLPPASAQSGAHATATPALTVPGGDVVLVFEAPASPLLEVDVVQRVTCTLTAPDGAAASCGQLDELVSARVQPSARSYSFNITAPAAAGTYTIAFERKSLLSIPISDAAAQTRITVAAGNLSDLADDSTTGGSPPGPAGGSAANPRLPATLLPTDDGLRWLVSVAMGTGVLVTCLVATRPRTGGRGP